MTSPQCSSNLEESETIELKTGLSELEDAIIDICALLNHRGGAVYFGVRPNGEIAGLTITDTTFRKVNQKIRARIKPEISLSLTSESYHGKSFLIVTVPEGTNKPYFADGQPYVRSGTESIRMPVDELKRIIRQEDEYHWDNLPCSGATFADIDPKSVSRFLQVLQEGRRTAIDTTISSENALERLQLISQGRPTNTAILLFGETPQRFIQQSEVRAGRFKGCDMSQGFLDMAEPIQGTLLEQITASENFIRKHINRKVTVGPDSFKRVEEWDYPLEALREAVTNALCHRDYSSSANVQIRIFDDRIEIWNPGTLPPGVTVESLKGEHLSRPKNKNIARLLYLAKMIEQWGTGTSTMVSTCLKYGLEEPEFIDSGIDFRVIIRKSDDSSISAVLSLLNNRQEAAFHYLLEENSHLNSTEYASLFTCTDRTARNDLKKMVEMGVLLRTGESKRTQYSLPDHFRIISGNFRKFPETEG